MAGALGLVARRNGLGRVVPFLFLGACLGWRLCVRHGSGAAERPASDSTPYFAIRVVDDQTGRGVPLVELRTVNGIRLYTDSNGVAAFYEPGLMNQDVFFFVRSHGYEFRKDGFGYRGRRVRVVPGGSVTLEIHRVNIAERLYRVTGAGIYRDSVLVGLPVPLRRPVLNAKVFGSDSVVSAVYRGRLYWFWGDTNRPSYPLGNFHVPGATSRLPGDGGLQPDVGVDLEYFVGPDGFAKPTAQMPGDGPTWINGLVVVPDSGGRPRLVAHYVKVRPPLKIYRHGLCVFDDERQQFEHLVTFPPDAPFYPFGHPFRLKDGDTEYVYFADPFPLLRAPADLQSLCDLSRYEAFTCLKRGSRLKKPVVERDTRGRPVYAWKKDTPPVGVEQQAKLVQSGRLAAHEGLLQVRDVNSGKAVALHRGSVYYNQYRRRWVLIAVQAFGESSFLGEVWYAEGDTPLGPWVYAVKVVTHEQYSFYNPKQHPYFDQDGGRLIYFEGTYTNTFSGNPDATPRYNYNQVMYRLDLSDRRVFLPVPVYVTSNDGVPDRFQTGWPEATASPLDLPIAFFAPDRPREGTVPVWSVGSGPHRRLRLSRPDERAASPVFYAVPPDVDSPPPGTVPLFEFHNAETGRYAYSTRSDWSAPGFARGAVVCQVWVNPWKQTPRGQAAADETNTRFKKKPARAR